VAAVGRAVSSSRYLDCETVWDLDMELDKGDRVEMRIVRRRGDGAMALLLVVLADLEVRSLMT
jgi:hypothetical protein